MITRVYGSVEGHEVALTRTDDGSWICIVPKTVDGEYAVELYAEDDAGNVSYFANMLFEVRATHVTAMFIYSRYNTINAKQVYSSRVSTTDYEMRMTECSETGGDLFGTDRTLHR